MDDDTEEFNRRLDKQLTTHPTRILTELMSMWTYPTGLNHKILVGLMVIGLEVKMYPDGGVYDQITYSQSTMLQDRLLKLRQTCVGDDLDTTLDDTTESINLLAYVVINAYESKDDYDRVYAILRAVELEFGIPIKWCNSTKIKYKGTNVDSMRNEIRSEFFQFDIRDHI